MAAEPTRHALVHDAAGASLGVLESAVALARAEAKLVVVRARTLFVAALVVALGVVIAVSFAQLALILVTVSPLFVVAGSPLAAAPMPYFVALGLAFCIALGGGITAFLAWRKLGERALGDQDGGES
jgi:hypothetical protein